MRRKQGYAVHAVLDAVSLRWMGHGFLEGAVYDPAKREFQPCPFTAVGSKPLDLEDRDALKYCLRNELVVFPSPPPRRPPAIFLTDRGLAEILKRGDSANPLVSLVLASAASRTRITGPIRSVQTLREEIDRKEQDLARDASVVAADDTYHRIAGSLHYLLMMDASQHLLREELNRRKWDGRCRPTLMDMYLGEDSAIFFDHGGTSEDHTPFEGLVPSSRMKNASSIHGPPLPRGRSLLTRRGWLGQRLLYGDFGPDGVVHHTIGETIRIVRNTIDSHSLPQHDGRLQTEMMQRRASFGDTQIVSQTLRWLGWYVMSLLRVFRVARGHTACW